MLNVGELVARLVVVVVVLVVHEIAVQLDGLALRVGQRNDLEEVVLQNVLHLVAVETDGDGLVFFVAELRQQVEDTGGVVLRDLRTLMVVEVVMAVIYLKQHGLPIF